MSTIRSLVLLALLLPTTAFAGARADLAAFTQNLKGLDGQFSQTVFDANGKLKETSSGRVALSTPRLFRWEYTKPYAQLIVADGRKVWVFDPDLSQVTVRPQGADEQNSPLAALIDPGKLEQQYNVAETGSRDGLEWLVLTPKRASDDGFQTATLGFGPDGLARMQVTDTLGQRTEIAFSEWKKNPAFARDTFTYTPAKGVDVVGEG